MGVVVVVSVSSFYRHTQSSLVILLESSPLPLGSDTIPHGERGRDESFYDIVLS